MPTPIIGLPELPGFPSTGTDEQKAAWFRLASLHMDRSSVQAMDGMTDANKAGTAAMLGHAEALAAALEPIIVRIERAQQASEAATDRLIAALAALPSIGAASSGEAPQASADGVTAADAAIVSTIIKASRGE